MTIRSGGRPRDPRDTRASRVRPYDADAYATESVTPTYAPERRGPGRDGGYRGGGGGGSGIIGIIKFLVFAGVLGGLVLVASMTVLRPVVTSFVVGWAADSPGALNFPFVADMVREDLGPALTAAASTDEEQVPFAVTAGDNASTIGARLEQEGLITDRRAFVFIATERGLTGGLQQGDFILRATMTPDEIVTALLTPQAIPVVDIALRTGLRLEQVTAKLQTVEGLQMDAREFYEIAVEPPASLIADYPWLGQILGDAPPGATLEGFLWPATYRVLPDTSPDELIRLMLDRFIAAVGESRLEVPEARGLTFHQVLTLASIVEREAVLDDERPVIAGVYQNRIDRLPGVKPGLLNADPTVIYAQDTVNLAAMDFDAWRQYVFWTVPPVPLAEVALPDDLVGYNSYTQAGLPPGPIATPTQKSIDAALEPNTEDKFIYFLAIPEGGGAHVFAKTKKEHDANRREYGYN
ncbi:hypothetical protein BH20CHL7_BH20CHL7_13200 [soil metagenome]